MPGTNPTMAISGATRIATRARARIHVFISGEMRPYEIEKGSCVEGLAEIAAGTRPGLQLLGRQLRERRDEHNGGNPPFNAEAVLQLEAAQSAKLHVQHH